MMVATNRGVVVTGVGWGRSRGCPSDEGGLAVGGVKGCTSGEGVSQ